VFVDALHKRPDLSNLDRNDLADGGGVAAECGDGGVAGGGDGGANGGSCLDFMMIRQNRGRDQTEQSSFGPGWFGSYDLKLHMNSDEVGHLDVFDPSDLAPRRFLKTTGGTSGRVAEPQESSYRRSADDLFRQHPDLHPEQVCSVVTRFYDHRTEVIEQLTTGTALIPPGARCDLVTWSS
jgi:hypothetical protein